MKKISIVLLLSLALIGCKDRPKYNLYIGDQEYCLKVHEDPKDIQDEIISKVKLVWYSLTSGNSVSFYTQRIGEMQLDDEIVDQVEEKFDGDLNFTSTMTSTSPKYRFFKNREGLTGMEQVGEEKTYMMISGEDLNWDSMETYLRGSAFYTDYIQWMIQQKEQSLTK